MDLMCWYVYSFGKKLTFITAVDQLLCIGHIRWPIETYLESFAD
jgi:hypothetical protein